MPADQLLEQTSARLLTEYQLLFAVQAEDADPDLRRQREADRQQGLEAEDETETETDPLDDHELRLLEEQRALIARLTEQGE